MDGKLAHIPRVLISPFAGVIVDRGDRKWLLVAMDALRGVVVVSVAVVAYLGYLRIWSVFAAIALLIFPKKYQRLLFPGRRYPAECWAGL